MLPTRFDMGRIFGLFVNVVAVAVSKDSAVECLSARHDFIGHDLVSDETY
jgi:hypothetical protein